jgi:hypothetical protein
MSCQVTESQAMQYECKYGCKQTYTIRMTSEYASGKPRGPHIGTQHTDEYIWAGNAVSCT